MFVSQIRTLPSLLTAATSGRDGLVATQSVGPPTSQSRSNAPSAIRQTFALPPFAVASDASSALKAAA